MPEITTRPHFQEQEQGHLGGFLRQHVRRILGAMKFWFALCLSTLPFLPEHKSIVASLYQHGPGRSIMADLGCRLETIKTPAAGHKVLGSNQGNSSLR